MTSVLIIMNNYSHDVATAVLLSSAVILWVLILRARHLSMYPVAGSIREGTA